jgi:hypothetical protein
MSQRPPPSGNSLQPGRITGESGWMGFEEARRVACRQKEGKTPVTKGLEKGARIELVSCNPALTYPVITLQASQFEKNLAFMRKHRNNSALEGQGKFNLLRTESISSESL